MLSESFAGEVNKAAELVLHKGKMPEFKYLLLWAYSKKCPLSSMDTKEAQRIIKLQLKNNDGSLLVLLLSKLRDLLQDKRNQFELAGSVINAYEKLLDKFYLSMIGQLKVLEEYVQQALDSWSVTSLACAIEACLQRGWCGDGDMCAEYTARFFQFKPLSNEKLEKCESKINSLLNANKNKFNRNKNYNDNGNYNNNRGRGSTRSRGSRGGRGRYNPNRNNNNRNYPTDNDRKPVPFQGGPGTPPPHECIKGTKLRKVYYFCDKFQIDACFWGNDCRYVKGHFCSYCGGPKHGRGNCPSRPADWS